MKKPFVLSLLFSTLLLSAVHGQESIRKIEYRQTAFGAKFYNQFQKLKPRDLREVTYDVPEANKYMVKAGVNNDISNILSFAGGALIGWPIGVSLAGDEPDWNLAYIGAAITVVAIPFNVGFRTNAIKGAEIYNATLESPPAKKKKGGIQIQMKLQASVNGAGLSVTF